MVWRFAAQHDLQGLICISMLWCLQTNKKGQKLQCSHFIPDGVKGVDGRIPCIIYCHCNSGSRYNKECNRLKRPSHLSAVLVTRMCTCAIIALQLHHPSAHVRGVCCACLSTTPIRRDAEEALYVLIPLGVSVFTLDFAGSGLSEGDWVTLGAHEVDDVQVQEGCVGG